MALLPEIGTHLQTGGIGTLGTNLFLGMMPDTPDACVAVYEYPGGQGEYVLGTSMTQIERPKFQVMARAAEDDYASARSKIQDVYTLLDAVVETDLSSKRYHRISAIAPPFFVERDSKKRPLMVCNFQAEKAV